MGTRYVIWHPEKGVFVGYRVGQRKPLWTATYAGGAYRVPTLTRVEAQGLIRQMRELRAKIMPCTPDDKKWASVHACMRAGIPGWIPDLPGANASDFIWEQFVDSCLKSLDGPPGRLECHRFDPT